MFLLALLAPAESVCSTYSPRVREADDYYLARRNPANVQTAIGLLRAEVRENPRNYEAWWRLSKFICYLARQNDDDTKVRLLNQAIDAGRHAVALDPNRPEGHFWLGANLGLLAEERGMLKGLLLVDDVRKEMEMVVRLNPDFDEAAGLRVLGRLYYRAPFFKGGDKRRALVLLQQSLQRYPDNSLTMLYLADTYRAIGMRDQARQQLEHILQLCPDPLDGPELDVNKAKARARLEKYFTSGY